MNPTSMLTDVIVDAFNTSAGKGKTDDAGNLKALKVSFSTAINYDTEDGYRQIDLLILAPRNYVAVLVRHRWNVIPIEGLNTGGPRAGYDYVKGVGDWTKISYHDSGWRSAIDSFLHNNARDIASFDNAAGRWFKVKSLSPDEVSSLLELPHGRLSPAPSAQALQIARKEEIAATSGRSLPR